MSALSARSRRALGALSARSRRALGGEKHGQSARQP